MRRRERKRDFIEACSELRGILTTEVRERWTHERFIERYRAFCRSERYLRLTGHSRDWLAGMVEGVHSVMDSVMTEMRHDLGDGVWLRSEQVPAGSWHKVVRSESFWIGTEDKR